MCWECGDQLCDASRHQGPHFLVKGRIRQEPSTVPSGGETRATSAEYTYAHSTYEREITVIIEETGTQRLNQVLRKGDAQ